MRHAPVRVFCACAEKQLRIKCRAVSGLFQKIPRGFLFQSETVNSDTFLSLKSSPNPGEGIKFQSVLSTRQYYPCHNYELNLFPCFHYRICKQ